MVKISMLFMLTCIGSLMILCVIFYSSVTPFSGYSRENFLIFFPENESESSQKSFYRDGGVVNPSHISQSLSTVEHGLGEARASIIAVSMNVFNTDLPNREIYNNHSVFLRSYLEMEKRFKVYVYEEGEPPLFHYGRCKGIYAVEGRFIEELDKHEAKFRTYDPNQAHVYFLPFSVYWMRQYISHNKDTEPMRTVVSDYIREVSTKHPFWNQTNGADHFMLSCHDWGPKISKANEDLFNRSIRVLCNANTSEGFNPTKDVTLPEIVLQKGIVDPKIMLSETLTASPRPYLGFFAGGLHGPVRAILFKHWKQRDRDMPVYKKVPTGLNYYDFMISSKFCLCPSGHEVASPRIVEAIYAECIPVILSINYVLPFYDVVRWETFSVQVDVSEIPRLKEILTSISDEKYEWPA